jgi:hypothetical protein
MANRLLLNLDAWAANLKDEPIALATATAPTVRTSASASADEVRNSYPSRETGNLRAGVRVDQAPDADPAIAAAVVVSGAPHAHLYEDGTRYARARPTFWPIVNRQARDMEQQLSAIVEGRNFGVTGTAGD